MGLAGFTLVELLVTLGIVIILAALLVPNAGRVLDRAQGVVCTSKLRNLWVCFSSSLTDGSSWPQLPAGIAVDSPEEQRWWLDYSEKNLGMHPSDWQCPVLMRRGARMNNAATVSVISYLPTLFDASPSSPKSWPRMPWFTEMAAPHGKGNLSVRADGSVCPVFDP